MNYRLTSVLFPPRCAGCGTLLNFRGAGKDFSAFCPDCRDAWESELLDTCGGCGLAVSLCSCRPEELARAHGGGLWKRVYYLHGKRMAPQNRILFKIKERSSASCMDFLSREMEKSLACLMDEKSPDLTRMRITYLPRSRRSALQSGTDQGRELAYALSRRTSIPVEPIICRHRRANVQQKTLSPKERRKNALDSYYLDKHADPAGKIYVLVDDVVTTGSTLAAGVRLLRRAGAEAVYALAIAVDDVNKNASLRQPHFKI